MFECELWELWALKANGLGEICWAACSTLGSFTFTLFIVFRFFKEVGFQEKFRSNRVNTVLGEF